MPVTEGLIKDCLRELPKAQQELHKECFRMAIGMCRRYANSSDDAVYLFNTAFIRILGNLKQYALEKPFEAWVKRIVRNTLIDDYRKKHAAKAEKLVFWNEATEVENTAAQEMPDHGLNAQDLYRCLDRLPPVTRLVFVSFAIEGYSHQEIAKELNISEGTSKWHVSHAREKLKEMIAALYV